MNISKLGCVTGVKRHACGIQDTLYVPLAGTSFTNILKLGCVTGVKHHACGMPDRSRTYASGSGGLRSSAELRAHNL